MTEDMGKVLAFKAERREAKAAEMLSKIDFDVVKAEMSGVDLESLGEDLLDLVEMILLEIAEGDQDFDRVRRRYNRLINQYQRRTWRNQILPTLQGIQGDDWVEEALLLVLLVRLLLRRLG